MPVVSRFEALEHYGNIPAQLRAPSLHPNYVVNDAIRSSSLCPTFFVHSREGEIWYHAFHAERIVGTDRIDVQSPYGYGGPIATTTDLRFLAEAWASFDRWGSDNRLLVEFIRFHPCLENWRYFAGDVIDNRETVWIDLSKATVIDGYATRARTAVKKAIASGVEFEWASPDSFLAEFPRIYSDMMHLIGAEESYHFPQAYFAELISNDAVWLGLCRKDSVVIGGAIFLAGTELVEYHLSASTAYGKSLAAGNLMIHRAAERAQDEGKAILHLGGGTDSSTDNKLLFFKRGFSKSRALFKIGRRVHQPSAYDALRREWELNHGTVSSRVLFYKGE